MSEREHPVNSDELQAYANNSLATARRGEVDAHLARCERCSDDVAAWSAVREAVRAAAPDDARDQRVLQGLLTRLDDPDELAERSRLAPPPPVVSTPASRRPSSRWHQRVIPKVAAAAVLIIAVVVAVVPSDQPAYADALMLAAADLEAAGSARAAITGEATVALGAADAAAADEAALVVAFDISGEGQIAVGQAAHTRVSITNDEVLGTASTTRTQEIIRIGEATYRRTDDSGWTRSVGETPGLLGRTLLAPDLPTVLRSAAGDPEDVGVAVLEGVRTRHLAFDVEASAMDTDAGLDLSYRAHAWIDDDDRLRKVRLEADGPASQPVAGYWRIALTLTLTDVGAPVDIRPPTVTQSSPPTAGEG